MIKKYEDEEGYTAKMERQRLKKEQEERLIQEEKDKLNEHASGKGKRLRVKERRLRGD